MADKASGGSKRVEAAERLEGVENDFPRREKGTFEREV